MGKPKGGDSIVVAVRVRPFNDREKTRNCELVIRMPDEKTTLIRDPKTNEEKPFAFDYSYWSHDGFEEKKNGYFAAVDPHYADQKRVFDDLGRGVLENAWAGYNCSLFAYGQTGSGKSYSIVGFKNNKGIVPTVCEELFNQIKEPKNKSKSFEVFVSMFEIYCEKVRDLLSDKPPPKGGLKIREHPKNGFYVENLSSSPVGSYSEIEAKINEGTKNRTIAATNMNATSSRAHTIVKITFVQKSAKSGNAATTKKSEINLVDLAGSERTTAAGTEGDRLKEGIIINQSLSTLGRVIKALSDSQKAKNGKKPQIPYRDSVLTSLLKNALGGNSKTIMIAAISPADINYEETLSTLRFADRAKSIKTNAIINENQTDRAMRELREENLKLQKEIHAGGDGSQEEIDRLKRLLEENQKEMENMEKTWQEKMAEEASKHASGATEKAEIDAKRKKIPHLWNLNEDAALTNIIVHFLPPGDVIIGNKPTSSGGFIQLNGLSILPQHASVHNEKNEKITITPAVGADILVNGKKINEITTLAQNDRVLFGGNHLYVFNNPTKSGVRDDVTYESAQKEIAQNSSTKLGLATNKEDLILEEELVSTLPLVARANAMATELKRNVKFEIVLVSPEMRGLRQGLTEVWIQVHNVTDDTHFLWEKGRFMNRYYGMQEIYEAKLDGEQWNVPKERDPFYEPPDSPIFVASCVVFLQSLAYLIESEEEFPLMDLTEDNFEDKVDVKTEKAKVVESRSADSGKAEIKAEPSGQFVVNQEQWVGGDEPEKEDAKVPIEVGSEQFYVDVDGDSGAKAVKMYWIDAFEDVHKNNDAEYNPGTASSRKMMKVIICGILSQGNEIGQLTVGLSPCSTDGKELIAEYVNHPSQLIGRSFAFKVKILNAVGLPRRIVKSHCKYRFFGSKEVVTKSSAGSSPAYGHENIFFYKSVSQELAEYLQESNLYISVWGTQKPRGRSATRRISDAFQGTHMEVTPNKADRIEKMVNHAKKSSNSVISLKALENVIHGDDHEPKVTKKKSASNSRGKSKDPNKEKKKKKKKPKS